MTGRWWKRSAALFCAAMLMSTGVYAEGLSIFDGAAEENNYLAAPENAFTYAGDTIALDDLSVSVVADGYTVIRQEDGFVYIYTQTDGSIPYVMIGCYDMVSDDFAADFTEFMQGKYQDLRVTQETTPRMLNGNPWMRVQYEYSVSGYTCTDTRLFSIWNGRTFMFGSKEVPSINFSLPSGYLEMVAASMTPLAGGYSDYEKHVDSSTSVEGSGPSVADLGGFDSGPQGTEGGDSQGTESSGSTGGEPVGGTVGGMDRPASESSGRITFDESIANYTGTWVQFDDGFQLYLPSEWCTYNVSDEMRSKGILYQAGYSSQADGTPWISVNFGSSGSITTLREVAQSLEYGGYTVDDIVTVNGIDCVSYLDSESDLCGLMFFHPGGKDYLICVIGFAYSRNVDMIASILCSLSPL